ncbi:DsbA family protein [Cohaesibacter intestini]|uniref:DsbA family protein n=1 Tax=Cohaesibacter intestini TaxID=2211145 RepID=UPI000DEBD12E|nr:DsbA family protein [Cohaesibacter intestini]
MKSLTTIFAASIIAFTPISAMGDQLTGDQIKKLALEAILENPEIIRDAITLLQEKEELAKREERKAVIQSQIVALEQDENAPVLGNPNGDVTVVEFFDYNCPYCKSAVPMIKAAIKNDPNLRIVYREWPILSEGSMFAARAALAAREQGKYEELHWELMEVRGRIDEAVVIKAAENVGLDVDKLRTDMKTPQIDAHIEKSMQLAQLLSFSGTPSFVVGENVAPGLISPNQLQDMIDEAREVQAAKE